MYRINLLSLRLFMWMLMHFPKQIIAILRMVRQKKGMKDFMGVILNVMMIVMIIPILVSALGTSTDPTVTALMAILPVIMIINVLTDIF